MGEMLRDAVARAAHLGAAGSALFVVSYALACAALFPVSILTFAAGAAFGVWRGFILVWLGGTAGACLSFLLGRRFLRGAVERRAARWPAFAAIDAAVSVQGWRVVLLVRLSPIFPFNFLNYAFGLTRVPFREYALASWAGMAPATFVAVWLGAAAGDAAKSGGPARSPLAWAFTAAGLAAAAAAVFVVGRTAHRALRKETSR